MTDTKKTAHDVNTGARKAYAAPKLEVFGEVSALTAGGSSGTPEGMAMTNLMRLA